MCPSQHLVAALLCLLRHLSCTRCQKLSQRLPAPNTSPVCAGTDIPGSQLGKQIQMKPAQQIQSKYLAFAEISFPILVCCVASWLVVLVSMWGELGQSQTVHSGSIWPYTALEMLMKLDFRFAKTWFPVF